MLERLLSYYSGEFPDSNSNSRAGLAGVVFYVAVAVVQILTRTYFRQRAFSLRGQAMRFVYEHTTKKKT